MNSIQGPGNIRYDSQHLQVSRRLTAESVKPNVFKEDEAKQVKLDIKDQVALSAEAKELLKQLKKENKKIASSKDDDFESLLGNLKKLKDESEKEDEEEEGNNSKKESKGKKLLFQKSSDGKYIIPISQKTVSDETNTNKPKQRSHARFSDIIDGMLVSDTTSEQRRLVIAELDVLGEKMLRFVKNFGTHIIVLKRNENLTQRRIKGMMIVAPGEKSFDGRPWEIVRGIYTTDRRLIVAGEELLGKGP